VLHFYATPSGPLVRDAMTRGLLRTIVTPAQGTRPIPGVPFCADNGKYGKGWPGPWRWGEWVKGLPRDGCAFVVAPDVPFNAAATLRLWDPAYRFLARYGYPAAFAAQDGQESLPVPWSQISTLFIAGSTEWKLGPHAFALIQEAVSRDVPAHCARVSSERRLMKASWAGCSSADGTYLAYGPDKNLPKLLGWLAKDTLFSYPDVTQNYPKLSDLRQHETPETV